MAIVLVISDNWMLRTGVRAELRERGIEAMGIESARDALGRIDAGAHPAVLVIDAGTGSGSGTADAGDPGGKDAAIGSLLDSGVPAILISSRTVTSPPWKPEVLLPRPVRVAEITAAVLRLLKGYAV
jgi:DNA-binding NarL/FixJ family response regulator